ncbi:MAG: GNAT family N-acetyltransferase [Planctomycetaceae bacterium]|nr:GNAT family N-acetyltransferase [Planctomycetaceae bacterium]
MTAAVPPPVIRRIAIDGDAGALALTAQAWPDIERPIQMAAIAGFVTDGKKDELVLIAAHRESRLCGALLGQVLAGRAAMVWPPQLARGEQQAIARDLLDELHRELRAAGTCVTQALLENARGSAAQILQAAGYQCAGEVLSMAAEPDSFPDHAPRLDFDLEPYSPAAHDRLIRLLEATYRGSLDCPSADGLRDAADVLAGYRAVSQFRPELWFFVKHDGNDAGCLLLADHPAQQQLEIVYLGVSPEHRGRGWGLALARHAQWLARQMGRQKVVLAVDAANRPAIGAYQAAGFAGWDRRTLLVHDFRPVAKQDAPST